MDIVFNWHITEACNYSCSYCFAKWDRPIEIWKDPVKVERLLSEILSATQTERLSNVIQGRVRINFAGGEPTLLGGKLTEITNLAKQFGIENSLITNGSLLEQNLEIIPELSMIGISIDSLVEETNFKIGRNQKNRGSLSYEELEDRVVKIRSINPCVRIKFNVVVNQHNYEEILIPKLMRLKPEKIKVFRELSAGGNLSKTTDAMFDKFIRFNHCESQGCWVEDNELMTQSYLMIDPYGRLFQNGDISSYQYSEPIHEVGLEVALEQIEFDKEKYTQRYKEVVYG